MIRWDLFSVSKKITLHCYCGWSKKVVLYWDLYIHWSPYYTLSQYSPIPIHSFKLIEPSYLRFSAMEGGRTDLALAIVWWKECFPTASEETVFGASPSIVSFAVEFAAESPVDVRIRQKVPFNRLMSIFFAWGNRKSEDTACYETEKELRMRTSTGPLGMCSEGFPLWNCGVCKIIGKETFWLIKSTYLYSKSCKLGISNSVKFKCLDVTVGSNSFKRWADGYIASSA